MRRIEKDEVTGVFVGDKTNKLNCEKIASRTITGIFAMLLVATIAISTEKGVIKEKALTEEKADDSCSVTTVTTSESPTTTTVTTANGVTAKKETTTTKAKTTKRDADSSSSPEVTTTTTTSTAAKEAEPPTTETYNVGNYTADTWVKNTTDITPITTTVETSEEVPADTETDISVEASDVEDSKTSSWDGPTLNSYNGIISGPSGNETYYNLNMSGVVDNMHSLGYDYEYWVRDDGVKMYGDYVMCAADLSTRPKGTIVETSLGEGIVCDTGGFVSWDPDRLDIATTW